MKDLEYIYHSLPVNFLANEIDIINYFCNKLLTQYSGSVFIPKKPE